jgi:hypothetical protein
MKLTMSRPSKKTQIAKFHRTLKNRTLLGIMELQHHENIHNYIINQFVNKKTQLNSDNDRSKGYANSDG